MSKPARMCAAARGSKSTAYWPRPMPRTMRLHGVAISRDSLFRSPRPDTGGVTEADPIMNPFLRVGGGRCSPGGGAGAPPARCSGAFGEGEAEEGGPLAFEHVDRPVQPFDAFAVDGDRAALDLVGVGEGAVQFGLEVERWHGGEVRAHHEHEPHQ